MPPITATPLRFTWLHSSSASEPYSGMSYSSRSRRFSAFVMRLSTTMTAYEAHELVDCYELPTYLAEQVQNCNAQMNIDVA